jgi:hypothetical protein
MWMWMWMWMGWTVLLVLLLVHVKFQVVAAASHARYGNIEGRESDIDLLRPRRLLFQPVDQLLQTPEYRWRA